MGRCRKLQLAVNFQLLDRLVGSHRCLILGLETYVIELHEVTGTLFKRQKNASSYELRSARKAHNNLPSPNNSNECIVHYITGFLATVQVPRCVLWPDR